MIRCIESSDVSHVTMGEKGVGCPGGKCYATEISVLNSIIENIKFKLCTISFSFLNMARRLNTKNPLNWCFGSARESDCSRTTC